MTGSILFCFILSSIFHDSQTENIKKEREKKRGRANRQKSVWCWKGGGRRRSRCQRSSMNLERPNATPHLAWRSSGGLRTWRRLRRTMSVDDDRRGSTWRRNPMDPTQYSGEWLGLRGTTPKGNGGCRRRRDWMWRRQHQLQLRRMTKGCSRRDDSPSNKPNLYSQAKQTLEVRILMVPVICTCFNVEATDHYLAVSGRVFRLLEFTVADFYLLLDYNFAGHCNVFYFKS